MLVYESDETASPYSEEMELSRHYRQLYEGAMKSEGLVLDQEFIGDYVFLKVHCPFQRLCEEAENVRLDLPLDGVSWTVTLWHVFHKNTPSHTGFLSVGSFFDV